MYPWLVQPYQQLCQRQKQGKLHHALLLQGHEGIGKNEFAQYLSRYLLCSNKQSDKACGECQGCRLNAAGSHPDLHIIESEKQIGVDQIRDAIKKLFGTSQMSGAKVLVIYAAHTMTESSANALLKTLEEPTPNTFLLLTTCKPERLLPTILSRCEKLLLAGPDMPTYTRWLEGLGHGKVDKDFLRLYANSPLTLLDELKEQQTFTYQQFLLGIEGISSNQNNPAELALNWQEHAEKVVKWLQYWLIEQLKLFPSQADTLWPLHSACVLATEQLRNPGINKSLLLANLLQHLVSEKKYVTSFR
ncbi:MAG: DNA polymerase-3 subunit delta' [Paraglaciecola sp.]|jgi:DNA polymerase-3 subunit delta'